MRPERNYCNSGYSRAVLAERGFTPRSRMRRGFQPRLADARELAIGARACEAVNAFRQSRTTAWFSAYGLEITRSPRGRQAEAAEQSLIPWLAAGITSNSGSPRPSKRITRCA